MLKSVAVNVQNRDLDRAQHAWTRAVQIAEADGDGAAADDLRGNLRMLDDIRNKLQSGP